jgi:aspartyl-tRNA(Asn)/glutamyl-tRNA(Gln) amidotransferase subunit A
MMVGNDTDLCFASATELVAAYRARTLSPVDVVHAVLARIDALNPRLNAFNLVDHDGALAAARASEARWASGKPLGPVDGVPASIKDILLTKGWPTLRGSKTIDPAGPWKDDAPAVARLRESGAVLLGKTTTPEFGWKGVTDSALTGVTRNPWHLEMTPGGSSGGAAAQVAAGMGQLAVGTDGGGSIRIPCAFSGITGLKPAFGRVPAWPLSPFGTVAHLGPMARTVADCALMLNVLAQPDARDWHSLPWDGTDWTQALTRHHALWSKGLHPLDADEEKPLAGTRVAFSPRLGYVKYVHEDVEQRVADAARVLGELGAHVEAVDPGFEDGESLFTLFWTTGAWNLLRKLSAEKLALVEPPLRAAAEHGGRYSLAEYLDAVAARSVLGERMRRFHEAWDVLVTPTVAVPAFEVERLEPASPLGNGSWTWWTPFSYPFNLTQQPAISVPCGLTDQGLPVGLQIVGPMHREDNVLRVAHAYEQATDHHRQRPPLAA